VSVAVILVIVPAQNALKYHEVCEGMILKDNHDVRDLEFSTLDQGMLVWIRDGVPKLCECRGRFELSIARSSWLPRDLADLD
jgi:hypothetical protein